MSTPLRISGSPPCAIKRVKAASSSPVSLFVDDQLAGDQQAPGRGIDEQRRAAAHMRAPVAAADLVADQRVAGGAIGNAQQRFGEAHQRDAFARVECKLQHQCVDAAGFAPRRAHALGERGGELLRGRQGRRGQGGFIEQRGERRGLVGAPRGRDSPAQLRRRLVGCDQRKGGLHQGVAGLVLNTTGACYFSE